jgi:glutathionylspermidine synthase
MPRNRSQDAFAASAADSVPGALSSSCGLRGERTDKSPLLALPALDAAAFDAVRRRMMLEHCKWDAQVGDVSALAPFPLVIDGSVWRQLAAWAEQLGVETTAAEAELLARPDLHGTLAVPRAIRRALRRSDRLGVTPAASRIMRFDFHFTTDGWRISEVNSDVPGGFSETASFQRLMAEHYAGTEPTGDPGAVWADAIAGAVAGADASGPVALVSATGLMEDTQVVSYVARLLRERGCATRLAKPEQLRWRDGRAHLGSAGPIPLSAVVRFYQGEWLPSTGWRCGWPHFFCGGRTPVTNPGSSLLVESKRFPLVWDRLNTPLPAWRQLLPETRDPREAPWQSDDDWLLKTAYCNNGDDVAHREFISARLWRAVRRSARWLPGGWTAQRRFTTCPLDTPLGPLHPCLGVYIVDGRAHGIYGRLAAKPVTDFEAMDVAVLIRSEGKRNL